MSISESLDPQAPKHTPLAFEPDPHSQSPSPLHSDLDDLHQMVKEVMDIREHHPIEHRDQTGVLFRGKLTQDSKRTYAELSLAAEQLGYTLYMQRNGEWQEIIFMEGVLVARSFNVPWVVHLLLLAVTLVSTIIAGSILVGYNWSAIRTAIESWNEPTLQAIYRDGRKFAIPLLLILGIHEMGHYVAARLHGVKVTLPFFIPLPLFGSLGTLGAVIFIQSPLRNRKMLFDVGIAGPLAGLIASIIVFVWGFSQPPTDGIPLYWIQQVGINRVAVPPLLEWLTKIFTDQSVSAVDRQLFYNYPQALAGWFGILLTSLNLLPLGQFDGGHIAFSMFGRRIAWPLAIGVALVCIVLGLTTFWVAWLLWPILAFLTGIRHPPPQDDISPLGWPRFLLGIFTFVLFAAMIVITPFYNGIG